MKIGFIGFGEAAYNISQGLYEEGVRGIKAADTMADHPVMGKLIHERAEEAHVELTSSSEEIADWADIVIAAVPSSYTLDVCETVKDHLGPDKIYADVSASTPKTKEKVWEKIRTRAFYSRMPPCLALFRRPVIKCLSWPAETALLPLWSR